MYDSIVQGLQEAIDDVNNKTNLKKNTVEIEPKENQRTNDTNDKKFKKSECPKN